VLSTYREGEQGWVWHLKLLAKYSGPSCSCYGAARFSNSCSSVYSSPDPAI